MAITPSATSPARVSNLQPQFGYQAVVQVVHSGTYATGGQTADLSAIFPTEVYGGRVIADTLNDGGYKSTYVLAGAGAPATGIIQMYWGDNDGVGSSVFVEVDDMTDLTAIDGQWWIFFGR